MSRRTRILNLNKICRTCLCERNDLKPIFNACLPDMLMNCTSIEVKEDDELPKSVCVPCFHDLSRFYCFKNKVEKCDRYLRQYLTRQAGTNLQNKSIIAQAATDADIDISNDGYQEIEESETSNSEDDAKLSDLKYKLQENSPKRKTRLAKTRANAKIESVLEDMDTNTKDGIQIVEETPSDIKDEIQLVTQIFSNDPPPLVPLIPIAPEQIPDFPADTNVASVELALKPISNETPPLVPIKPLKMEPVTFVSNLEPNIQQNMKFFCNFCNDEFTNMSHLKNHVSTMHPNISSLTCNICKKEFSDRKRLIGHLKGHMVVKQYACKLCGKRYPNPSTFKVHMRSHTGERPFKCQICNKGFIRWAGVVGHMKSHQTLKPYNCDMCDKSFKISSNLERHKALHTGSMPFCCNYCGKTFRQSDNLQTHIRTHHTYERPFLCSQCGKGFVSSTRLTRHMWIHSATKPYSCATCNKSYSNSTDLKNHEKTHSGGWSEDDKPYACLGCNMRFFHPCRLMKHAKTHERPYSCPNCLKTFSREDILNKHIVNKHGPPAETFTAVDADDNNIYEITY